MKTYEQKTVTRVETTVRRTCDLCGVEAPCSWTWSREANWKRDETTIEVLTGDVWPEGDCRTRRWVDVCPSCFAAKVVPAIEALGCKFHEEDVER